jgi:RNA polymerase sigma-70 factor (ECF subfamily)
MSVPFESSFVTAVANAYPIAPDALAELAVALREHLEAARGAWPGVHVSGTRLAEYLAERVPDDGAPARALASMRTEDLYLACACVDRVRGAAEAFERAVMPAVAKAVAGIDRTPHVVEDVCALVRAKLLVGEADRPPRVASYLGRGPLTAFAQVVAIREARSLQRGVRHEDVEQAALLDVAIDADDPELAHLKRTLREPFRRAFREALAELSPRARTLLRLYLVEDVSSDALARMYGVHRATIARWIADARAEVHAGTRDRLSRELRLDRAAFESVVGKLASQLDVSLATFLGPLGDAHV